MTTTTIGHTFNNNHFELTEEQLCALALNVETALESATSRSVTLKGIKADLIGRVSMIGGMADFAASMTNLLSAFRRFDGLVHVLTAMVNDVHLTLADHEECLKAAEAFEVEEENIDINSLMDQAHSVLTSIQDDYMMEISELTDYEEWRNRRWSEEFIAVARDMLELKLIGSGHFAGVFRIANTETVLKIGFKLDDAGAAYAAYCRANPSKHVPEIKALRRFHNCYMVVMPLYETTKEAHLCCEMSDKLYLQVQYEAAHNAVENGCDTFDADDLINYTLVHQKWYEPVKGLVTNGMAQYNTARYMLNMMSDAMRIHNYFTGSVWFDLHGDNVMWVNDSSAPGGYRIIITDPMIWTCDKEDPLESGRV